MSILESQSPQQDWNYFLALDDDVGRLARYLEPTTGNYSSYSLELARILFVAASEVDVLSKRLCRKIDRNSKANNIRKYRETIFTQFPKIKDAIVEMPRFGLVLNPWEQWGKNANPIWWSAYNNVKHHRNTHFSEANLKNALDVVGGLFILLLLFYLEEAEKANLNPPPMHFRIGSPFYASGVFLSDHYEMVYKLIPDTPSQPL
jgi:hypothetical protein